MRWWTAAFVAFAGCDASFERFDLNSSLSPDPGREDLGPADEQEGAGDAVEVGVGPDAAGDNTGSSDLGSADAGPDDGGAPDVEVVLAAGDWEDRGYRVSGSAQIVRLADGRHVIRMSEDFVAFNLPGPTLLFSDRSRIGRSGIQASDVRIGRLTQLTGAVEIEIPLEATERAFAWIYCEPFSADMHAAELLPR